jgi:clan AA aspartic protease (TIGR02281 family)
MALAATLAFNSAIALADGAGGKCQLVRIAEWPVRFVHNKILLDGSINGRKIGVEIDTGAADTLILRSSAERLGLPLHEVRGMRLYGIGGETRVHSADVDEISISGVTRKDMKILVAGEHGLADAGDVILGQDFLAHVDLEFDLAHDAIRLFEPSQCQGVSLAYWSRDGGSSVEMDAANINSHIWLKVDVNGVPVDAMLDSGAGVSLLDGTVARQVGVTPETPGVTRGGRTLGIGAKPLDTWIGKFTTIVIGNERIRDAKVEFADFLASARIGQTGSNVMSALVDLPPMILGADFIRAHRLLVSHGRRRIYFTYVGGPVFGLSSADEASMPPGQAAKSDK